MSATAVLFVGGNHPQHGREKEAMAFWLEKNSILEGFQKKGYFERFDSFALTPHGGDLNFVVTLFGERAKLDELRRTDEFEAFVFKLLNTFTGVGVIPGVTGAGMAAASARRDKAL